MAKPERQDPQVSQLPVYCSQDYTFLHLKSFLFHRLGTPVGRTKEASSGSQAEIPDSSKCSTDACEHSQASKKAPAPTASLNHCPESFSSCPTTSVHRHLTHHHYPRGSVLFHGQYSSGHSQPGLQSCDCTHIAFWPSALPLCHSGLLCQEQLTRHSDHPPV